MLFCLWLLATAAIAADTGRTPWQRHAIDNSSRGADGVRLADVDQDGYLDIATGWEEGGVIRAYLNPGPDECQQRWPAVTVGKVKSPEDAVFVDLDGDGSLDVVSCCEGKERSIYFHWAPTGKDRYLDAAAWRTDAVPICQRKQSWMFALPMDVDGVNGTDLIVSAKGSNATIGWLQSPANPRDMSAWRFHPLYDAGWIMSLQAHDIDRDGDLDVLATDRKGARRGVLWLENPGAAAAADGMKWKTHRIGGEDREVMFLCVGDLDGDRNSEIICAVRGRGISVFRRSPVDSTQWSHFEIPLPSGCGTGKGVVLCDVNLDKQMDIVFSCENANGDKSGLRWLSYNKTPFSTDWTDHEISGARGVKFDRLEAVDLDGDGDLELITCEERDNLGVIWYENPAR